MKKIAILFHSYNKIHDFRYFLNEFSKIWKNEGLSVSVLYGTGHRIDADLAILHVSLTIVPDDYLTFVRQYPLVINGSVKDISKRSFSNNIVRPGDGYDGPVIIKTNRNCGGDAEALLTKNGIQKLSHSLQKYLPWDLRTSITGSYPIFDSVKKLSPLIWLNRSMVVEKFTPELHDGFYCLRTWIFFGDKETNSICYSKSPIVKSNNVHHRETLNKVPDELRKIRANMGFDFGKFDYAIVNDKVILYDVNRTPTLGEFHNEQFMPSIRTLAEGIYTFLPKTKSMATGHWPEVARLWKQIGPPLRPSEQDIHFVKNEINSWARDNGTPRALILGVTPELYNLPWPKGTDLIAVDQTKSMIDAVWPGPRDAVICADWTSIPLKVGSREIVLCDGGIHLMRYPDHQIFVKRLQSVISAGGLCIFRLFIPPKKNETTQAVLNDLLDSKISNLNILKLRLIMSLHENTTEGVELKKVWYALRKVAPDFNELSEKIGWPLEHLLTINTYRDSPNRYYFLNLDDIRNLFCKNPGGFDLEAIHEPTYELGDQCPTIVLRRTYEKQK